MLNKIKIPFFITVLSLYPQLYAADLLSIPFVGDYLESFGYGKDETKRENLDFEPSDLVPQAKDLLKPSSKEYILSPWQTRLLGLEVLTYGKPTPQRSPIFGEAPLKDLKIYSGPVSSKKVSFLGRLKEQYPFSSIAESRLFLRLSTEGTNNIVELKRRQEKISYFAQRPELRDLMKRKIFSKYGDLENTFLGIYDSNSPIYNDKSYGMLYPAGIEENLGKYPLYLQYQKVSNEADIILDTFLKLLALFVAYEAIYPFFAKDKSTTDILKDQTLKLAVDFREKDASGQRSGEGLHFEFSWINKPWNFLIEKIAHIADKEPDVAPNKYAEENVAQKTFSKRWTLGLVGAGITVSTMTQLFNRLSWNAIKTGRNMVIQDSITKISETVSQFVEILKQMDALITITPSMLAVFPDLAVVSDLLKSPEMQELIQNLDPKFFELKEERFNAKYWLNLYTGNIRRAFALIREKRIKLIAAIQVFAEVEMTVGLSEIYANSQKTEHPYSFPTYISDATSPYLNLNNYWNPILPQGKSVKNSLTLGSLKDDTHPQHAIITGPPMAGKSTISNATLLIPFLGQTLGMVPAVSVTMTPFSQFWTHMEIVADVAKEFSLNKSEMYRAEKMLRTFQGLGQGQFGICAIDEIFSSTNHQSATIAANQYYNLLGELPVISTTTTHLKEITELERRQPNVFVNYHVSGEPDASGNIAYDYKLKRGPSDDEGGGLNIFNETFHFPK